MNGWSLWKRFSTRLAVGSLALSLGLASPAAAQTPLTLPPYGGHVRTGNPVVATSTSFGQKDAPSQETPNQEIPREIPKTDAPVVIGEAAASCATCGPQSHSLFGLFHPQYNTGGCGAGGCGRGGCSSCGSGGCVNGTCGPQACYSCGYNGCFPGHQNCCPIDEHAGPIHRFFACFYHCICCPDPCYEPRYIVEANSAFWVDSARPATMTRVRWDSAHNFTQPDRSEWFWAPSGGGGGKGPAKAANSIDYNALAFYQEAATARASIFIEQIYQSVSPDNGPQTSGFGDMNIGTKGLLLDCELMQVTFQFRTYLPVGNFGKGLGAGHVSLEPSLLATVKLLPETYFQGQLSEWIPIGADTAFAGSILHYHMSLNHVLYRCQPDIPFIGTLEFNGYSFQDGLYTPGFGLAPVMSSGETWMTFGPGLRTAICNKLDFGVSAVFAIGATGSPEQIYRTEARFRF